jgi:hypothetical protein
MTVTGGLMTRPLALTARPLVMRATLHDRHIWSDLPGFKLYVGVINREKSSISSATCRYGSFPVLMSNHMSRIR